ncbi:hypothetical protein HYX11_03195 [Candidatus Woesearchaeota archaeon]|nr:hypothetical protein [Candidatus Woesearchaeota archaeon]
MVRNIIGKHQSYYEATLQLRAITPEMLHFVNEEIAKNKIHVAKCTKVNSGLDYQLSDNKFAQNIGKKIQQKFGGKVLTTAALFSKRDGNDIYRLTVLFRGVPFKKDEQVLYKGDEHTVIALGKEIVLQNNLTKKKKHVKYREMNLIKKH